MVTHGHQIRAVDVCYWYISGVGSEPSGVASVAGEIPRTRRRGQRFADAVYGAAVAEIGEVGLRAATMTSISKRAGTGKSALYRRWPNVRALVLDAPIHALEETIPATDRATGPFRDNMVASLVALSAQLNSTLGIVVRELITASAHNPAILVELQHRFVFRKELEVVTLLHQAMADGEFPHRPIAPYVLEVAPALMLYQLVSTGSAPSEEEVTWIVDGIVMPLLRNPPGMNYMGEAGHSPHAPQPGGNR